MKEFATAESESPIIDLTDGWDSYLAARIELGSQVVKRTETAYRRLERDIGSVRTDHNIADTDFLDTMFKWKPQQYESMGAADIFSSYPWTKELLRTLHQIQSEIFPDYSHASG